MPTPFHIRSIGGVLTRGLSRRAGATVCLHGGPGGNSQLLSPFFPADRLSGAWYFADIPNHGRSGDTGGDWSPETCIEALDLFAQELDEPLRVVGLSWGTNVAVEWATAHPERFQCLVGISGAGHLEEIARHQAAVIATMPSAVHALMADLETATGDAAKQIAQALWEATLPFWMAGNPGLETYREGTRGFASDPEVNRAYVESWLTPRLNPTYLRQCFETLTLPVLLVRGLDDRMGNERSGLDVYISSPHVEVLHMEEAGHCPFVDQPHAFFEAVEAFFDSVERAPEGS